MKKILIYLFLSSIIASSALADIELTLIDKDGNQTSQCVKSYSFSNNLESMSRQNGNGREIYSTNESLTNKVFLGKPVYRKMIDAGINKGTWSTPHGLDGIFEKIWVEDFFWGDSTLYSETHTYLGTPEHRYYAYVGDTAVYPRTATVYGNKQTYVILEYTKKSDVQNSESETFESYLHYIPSSSATREVTTVNLKETGVRFLDNFTYDSNSDSCTAN